MFCQLLLEVLAFASPTGPLDGFHLAAILDSLFIIVRLQPNQITVPQSTDDMIGRAVENENEEL